MPRTIVPITFGAGVDRATGRSAAAPSSYQDLRNVLLEDARLRLRYGFQATGFTALAAGTDVCAIAMLEATLDIIFVLFERSTRALTVYRLNPLTTPALQSVGTWGTVNAAATLPPVISWAECKGVLLLAHAEPTYSYRLQTQTYTPNATDATVGALAGLTADLNGDATPAAVYFRGVYSYNDSMWGFGYGEETSTATANRPEVVRVSKPGDPTAFVPEAYFLAGQRSVPVTGLAAIPQVGLVVGKTTSCYLISGTDAETYGITLLDGDFGNVSDRTLRATRGAVWMWSLHGPRVTQGGPTVDMSASLAFDAPQPSTLPTAGPVAHAFAFYDLVADAVEFVFPDWLAGTARTLSYVASLRDPTNVRWSYCVREALISCASWVILGKEDPPTLTAYADFTASSDAGIDAANAAQRKVSVTWNNSGTYIGSESYEIYIKPSGGAWSLLTTIAHNNAATQSATITGFLPLQDYDIAMRATRSGAYTSGYTGADPDAWVAGTAADSKTTVQTSCGTPTMGTALWSRISTTQEQLTLAFTLADTQAPYILEKSSDNVSWSTVTTYTTAPFSRSLAYTVGSGESATSIYFRVTPKRGSITGTSATGLLVYVGPGQSTHGYTTLFTAFERFEDRAHFVWSFVDTLNTPAARNVVGLEVEFSDDGSTWSALADPWSWEQLRTPYYQYESVGLLNPGTNYFRWRSVITVYSATHYTPWQTLNWVGVDASVSPSVSLPSTLPPDYPTHTGYATTYTFVPSATCASGQTHAVFFSNGSALRFAEVKSGNGGAQVFSVAPSTAGLSSWQLPGLTIRYVVRQSDAGAARTESAVVTQVGGYT